MKLLLTVTLLGFLATSVSAFGDVCLPCPPDWEAATNCATCSTCETCSDPAVAEAVISELEEKLVGKDAVISDLLGDLDSRDAELGEMTDTVDYLTTQLEEFGHFVDGIFYEYSF